MTSQANRKPSEPSPLDSLDPLNPIRRPQTTAAENSTTPPVWKLSESKQEEYATRTRKMKAVFNKFVGQLKDGCPREICFSEYCKKNTLSNHTSFSSDQQMMRFALRTLSASRDPEKLICSRTVPLSRSNLKLLAKNDSQVLTDTMRDVQAFCCSFARTADEDEELEVLPQSFT